MFFSPTQNEHGELKNIKWWGMSEGKLEHLPWFIYIGYWLRTGQLSVYRSWLPSQVWEGRKMFDFSGFNAAEPFFWWKWDKQLGWVWSAQNLDLYINILSPDLAEGILHSPGPEVSSNKYFVAVLKYTF